MNPVPIPPSCAAQRRDRFMTQRHPSRGTGGTGGGGLPRGSFPKDVSVLAQTNHARVQGRQFRGQRRVNNRGDHNERPGCDESHCHARGQIHGGYPSLANIEGCRESTRPNLAGSRAVQDYNSYTCVHASVSGTVAGPRRRNPISFSGLHAYAVRNRHIRVARASPRALPTNLLPINRRNGRTRCRISP